MKLDESRHGKPENIRATAGTGAVGNRPKPGEAGDNSTAQIKQPDLHHKLMEEVLEEILERMDGWIRRRLRSLWWMLRKSPKKRREALMELGIKEIPTRRTSSSGRGPWRISRTPSLHQALNRNYFDKLNLVKLEAMWEVTRLRWKSRQATT